MTLFKIFYIIIEFLTKSIMPDKPDPYIISRFTLTNLKGMDSNGKYYYIKDMVLVDGYTEFKTNIVGKIYPGKIILYYKYKEYAYMTRNGNIPGRDFLEMINRKYFAENTKGLELILRRTGLVIPFDVSSITSNERHTDELMEYIIEFDKKYIIPDLTVFIFFDIGGDIIIRLNH